MNAAVNLAALTSNTSVSFANTSGSLTGGSLTVGEVIGNTAISNFGLGDTLTLTGLPVLNGNILTLPTGTIDLGPPQPGTAYTVNNNSNGTSTVAVTPKTVNVYRFFDSHNGTQFFTASESERQAVAATRPDLVPEGPNGVGLYAVDPASNDPTAVPVFRFFDTKFGTHFFTASQTERDTLIASRSDLVYEQNGTFYEHASAQSGDVPVYRFFDSVHGTHFYTASETERASIAQSRTDLVAEGIGFYAPGHATT